MWTDFGNTTPPSTDPRWRLVGATMRRHGYRANALIETLHTVQETFGYLDEQALRYVAGALRVPLSQVYGVATFYHFFNLKPQGKHTCVICTGTACYIKGVPGILTAVEEQYGIKPGETTLRWQYLARVRALPRVVRARSRGSHGRRSSRQADADWHPRTDAESGQNNDT